MLTDIADGGDSGEGGGSDDGSGHRRRWNNDDEHEGHGRRLFLFNPFLAAWSLYSSALDRNPLVAKAMTASFVGGLGDALAQSCIEKVQLDARRVLGVMFDGLLVSGPGLHVGYAILERTIPCAGRGSVRNVIMQLMVDEFVFDPLFIGAFFFSTGAIEGCHPIRETIPNWRKNYFPTLGGAILTSLAFTPVQFCSFRYLPVKFRVLVVNCCDVAWYAAVSFGRHADRHRASTKEV